jgi:glycosyltransferase involved in cell wall biosynthesis
MKVFFVNTNKKWGGGEKWHLDAAGFLKRKGYDVAILTLYNHALYNRAMRAGITTLPIRITNTSFLNPFRLLSLVRLLKREGPDILILNFSADIKAVGPAAKIAGIKNIIYRRGSAIPIRNTIFNRLLYRKFITRIIANSKETYRSILQNNKNLFPPEKIEIIYNGIDLKQFDALPVTSLYQRRQNEAVIGSAGRLILHKGYQHLIEAAGILQEKKVNFKILIAGEGPAENHLKHLVHNAKLDDRIEFLGFVQNMKSFMENIDIFVLASLSEGFGYVLAEAMACGKPVVAFNNSSIPEIIADKETGYMVNNADMNDLSLKIEKLIADRSLCESFGKAGRKRVENFFEFEKVQHNLETLLLGMMNN